MTCRSLFTSAPIALVLLAGCQTEVPVLPLGPTPGYFALTLSPRSIPAQDGAAYAEAFALGDQLGLTGRHVGINWREVETSPGTFDLSDFARDVALFGNQKGRALQVTINVINTTRREVPADLENEPFDSNAFIARFQALLDAVLPLCDQSVKSLSIGNEVDGYLPLGPTQWAAYQRFYEEMVAYLHSKTPQIQVGVVTTFDGAAARHPQEIAALNRMSDAWVITYYPTSDAFQVRSPDAPLADFATMVALAGGKPVILQEVGYPSAGQLASSEELQAEFVGHVFDAWRRQGAVIEFLGMVAMHDFSDQTCDEMTAYYGFPGVANFKAFLCSLGLRRTDGTPKAAWNTLLSQP